MNDYLLNIISSSFSFTTIALTLTLSLGFWGRLVLRLLRLEANPRRGRLQTVVAGAALAAFAANLGLGFANQYRLFLTVYFYAGLLGFLAELALVELPGFWKVRDKAAELGRVVRSHDDLVALMILSAALSALHSAYWPSGEMELWTLSNQDCYFWPLLADYWLGLVDPAVIPVSPFFLHLLFENFGSHTLFGLIAVAGGQSATRSLPVFLLLMTIWCGLGVRRLARIVFGLGALAALAVTLGVVGGAFFTYLFFAGTSPQLVAMVAFLAALEALFEGVGGGGCDRRAWARVLVPVSFILVAYQGGFVCFVAILGLARGYLRIFALDGIKPMRRLERGAMAAAAAFLGLTAASAALYPWLGSRLLAHTVAVAGQTSGWNLPFLGGRYLLGLPIFPETDFRFMESASEAPHLVSLAIVAALALLLARRSRLLRSAGGTASGGQDAPASGREGAPGGPMLALTATFVFVSMMYVGARLVKGDFYQLWKFASYVVLPLSFVPTSLAITLLSSLGRAFGRALVAVGALSLLACLAVSVSPPARVPGKVFGVQSARPYFRTLRLIFDSTPAETEYIFYLRDESTKFFAAEFIKYQKNNKFNLINFNYIFNDLNKYNNFIKNKKNFLFISDIEFNDIFMSQKGRILPGSIYTVDPLWLTYHGYNNYYGVELGKDWRINRDWFTVEAKLPQDLQGQPVSLAIRLSPPDDPARCAPALSMAFHAGGPPVWSPPREGLTIEGVAPPEFLGAGTVRASVKVVPASGESWRGCVYYLESAVFQAASPFQEGAEQGVSPGDRAGAPEDGSLDPD